MLNLIIGFESIDLKVLSPDHNHKQVFLIFLNFLETLKKKNIGD